MKKKDHKIKHPKDLTGYCPKCKKELKELKGKGYCYCSNCDTVWTFVLTKLN